MISYDRYEPLTKKVTNNSLWIKAIVVWSSHWSSMATSFFELELYSCNFYKSFWYRTLSFHSRYRNQLVQQHNKIRNKNRIRWWQFNMIMISFFFLAETEAIWECTLQLGTIIFKLLYKSTVEIISKFSIPRTNRYRKSDQYTDIRDHEKERDALSTLPSGKQFLKNSANKVMIPMEMITCPHRSRIDF